MMNEYQHDRRGWYKKYKAKCDECAQLAHEIGQLRKENIMSKKHGAEVLPRIMCVDQDSCDFSDICKDPGCYYMTCNHLSWGKECRNAEVIKMVTNEALGRMVEK